MKITIVILACVVGIVLLMLLVRSRIAPAYTITARDIPEVVKQLHRSGRDGHFAVLMFVPPGSSDGEAVNLQYSIEHGAVGLDWVLLGPRNIADQKKISEFASRVGYHCDEHEFNGVRYLRIAGDGIADLGARIIDELYELGPGAKLELITEGFQWQSQRQSHGRTPFKPA
jgi:hypothetical protein